MARGIALVLQGLDQGGAVATCCLNQAKALCGEHRVRLFTDAGNGQATFRPVPAAMGGLEVERLRVPRLGWMHRFAHVPRQALFIVLVGLKLLQQRRGELDLVLFHSHPPTALLAPLLRRRGYRVAMVMHGDIFDRPPGTYDPRITWWYRITTHRAYRQSDAVLALSPYMANFARLGGAAADRIHLVPNGVDPEEIGLNPAEQVPLPTQPSLLYVGRIEFNKGVDLLVEAFLQLSPRWPELELRCIGSPDPAFLHRLRQRLAGEPRVHFLPPQPRPQLGRHYQEAAVVVVPSRSETQSTVLMEAMAAGRPVLASATGGNPMLVENGRSGRLFRSGDASDLAAVLAELLEQPDQLQAMGDAARQRHHCLYSRARSAAALREAIEQILAPDSETGASIRGD